jgi:hypothetical protein
LMIDFTGKSSSIHEIVKRLKPIKQRVESNKLVIIVFINECLM